MENTHEAVAVAEQTVPAAQDAAQVACAAKPVRLTPTQQRLLGYIAAQTTVADGARCSKKDFAQILHCDIKTIDRAVARLRRENMIEVEARHLENGGQLPNLYRVAR